MIIMNNAELITERARHFAFPDAHETHAGARTRRADVTRKQMADAMTLRAFAVVLAIAEKTKFQERIIADRAAGFEIRTSARQDMKASVLVPVTLDQCGPLGAMRVEETPTVARH